MLSDKLTRLRSAFGGFDRLRRTGGAQRCRGAIGSSVGTRSFARGDIDQVTIVAFDYWIEENHIFEWRSNIARFKFLLDNQGVSKTLQNAISTHFGRAFMIEVEPGRRQSASANRRIPDAAGVVGGPRDAR
jgi:hypothetical protein